jgi:hypothetical protein
MNKEMYCLKWDLYNAKQVFGESDLPKGFSLKVLKYEDLDDELKSYFREHISKIEECIFFLEYFEQVHPIRKGEYIIYSDNDFRVLNKSEFFSNWVPVRES